MGTVFLANVKIECFNFDQSNNEITVVKRQPSLMSYGNGERFPDKVWKEVYRVESEELKLVDCIEGKHTPSHYVEEKDRISGV